MGGLIFAGRFPQKSPAIGGDFADRDLRDRPFPLQRTATHCICNTLHLQHTASATYCICNTLLHAKGKCTWWYFVVNLQKETTGNVTPWGFATATHFKKTATHLK